MRVVPRPDQSVLDKNYIKRVAEDYKKAKEAQEQFEKRTNALKKELSEIVDTYGTVDDKGNRWLELDDIKLKRERRIQRSLDSSGAEQWAKENGLWDEVKEIIEVLSEDKLLGLAWDRQDLEDTIQAFYIEKEIWAFKA